MRYLRTRHGYIFLVGVLVIGVIATTTMVSLLLLGWAAEQNGFALVQSSQAYSAAQTCAEQTLQRLRTDLTYAGSGSFALSQGTCRVLKMGGGGNFYRTICVEGRSGLSVRRLEINVQRVLPSTSITSWQEVLRFTLCS